MNNSKNDTEYSVIEEEQNKTKLKENWEVAFGLQRVDYLTPSKYMVNLANENIAGKITYNEVEDNLKTHYNSSSEINYSEREADEVSIRIVKLLNDRSFSFSIATFKEYHKILFEGINIGIDEKYIGNFREENIHKKEPVLNGETVIYADYRNIEETLKYDFEEESRQRYAKMPPEKMIERISNFTSSIWQVHPFREGNTRTTAVFIQKYLNSRGFNVKNDLFKDNSIYFRNALVRSNYANYKEGIDVDFSYLYAFFENLLLGKNNVLDNKLLYIDLPERNENR